MLPFSCLLDFNVSLSGRCSNYGPKVSPGNNYVSFHGQAYETKTRLPAGYLRGQDPFGCIFPSVTFKSLVTGSGLPWVPWVWWSIVKLLGKSRWDQPAVVSTLGPLKLAAFPAFCLTLLFCLSSRIVILFRLQHSGANPSWSHQHWYQTGQLLWKARRRQLPRWVCCMCVSEMMQCEA